MSNFIDTKYLHLLSSQLDQFKRKNDTVYNFRCPYCGDSQTDKNKARGYMFLKEGNYIFKCHNCGKGASVGNLIRHVNPQMHKEYSLERFGDRERKPVAPKTDTYKKFQKKEDYLKTALGKLKRISQLKYDHPVKKYIENRKIPPSRHGKLFYSPKFYAFVNQMVPNKIPNIGKDEPRLIIPLLDSDNKLLGFQGRAFGSSKNKYITIMMEEGNPKIYGLDTTDLTKPVYVLEGPIDSMFIPNSIAMAGADVSGLQRYSGTEFVFVYDNEPRSKEIVGRIEKTIAAGNKIVLFPNYIEEKDINDMIMAGTPLQGVLDIISNNTFNGLEAKAMLSKWRKC
jgi:hypothetical protein